MIKPRTSYEISIIGHELKKNATDRGYHTVYLVEIVPPDHAEDSLAWRVSRRYDDFFALDGYLRRSRSLNVPKLPGKRYFRSSTSQAFLDKRQKRLEVYLKSLTMQAIVWEQVDFKRFIDRTVQQYHSESTAYYASLAQAKKTGAARSGVDAPLLQSKKSNSSMFACCWKNSPPPPAPAPAPAPAPVVKPEPIPEPVPEPAPVIEEVKEVPIPVHNSYAVLERSSADGSASSFHDSYSDIHSGESKTSNHSYQPRFKSNRRHTALSPPPDNSGGAGPLATSHGSFSSSGSASSEHRTTPTHGGGGAGSVNGSRRTTMADSRRSLY
jgi:hypothetical protein